MCTPRVIENATIGATAGAATGSAIPGLGTITGGLIGGAAGTAKGVIEELKPPKPPAIVPPKDLAGEERRRRLRAIQANIGSIPSGRQATIRTRGALTPGAPAPILKSKLGQ